MKPGGFIVSNHGKILRIPWFVGAYSYSNMTNYFKLNNYCKFYSKTVIVDTAIMSDNSNVPGYVDFTHEIFPKLNNQNRGHSHVMLEWSVSTGLCV